MNIDVALAVALRDGSPVTLISDSGRGATVGQIAMPLLGYVGDDFDAIHRWSAAGKHDPHSPESSPRDLVQCMGPGTYYGPAGRLDFLRDALALADSAMLEVLASECVRLDGHRFGLVDSVQEDVFEVEEAMPAIQEAFAWLKRRGFAAASKDMKTGFIILLLQPSEIGSVRAPSLSPALLEAAGFKAGLAAAKDLAWREYKDNGKAAAAYTIHEALLARLRLFSAETDRAPVTAA